jgi:hypothetical protein
LTAEFQTDEEETVDSGGKVGVVDVGDAADVTLLEPDFGDGEMVSDAVPVEGGGWGQDSDEGDDEGDEGEKS